MEQEVKPINTSSSSLLVSGLIYFLLIAVAMWLLYAVRLTQIKMAESKTQSIKEEIQGQISEDELAQLEIRATKIAALYGKPFATKLLREVAGAIPRNTTLTSLDLAGGQLTLQGSSASFDEVSLFATALNKQSTVLQNIEITQVVRNVDSSQGAVGFSLQADLK